MIDTASNSLVTGESDILKMTEAMRDQIMEVVTDADLAYRLPGNVTFGELLVKIGQVQKTYADSFKTFTLTFEYAPVDAGMATSAERLKAWFAQLDAEMDANIAAMSEEDVQNRMIQRGFPMPARVQIHCYREALLIFYGRAVLYLNALGKPIPQQLREWVD